jgi:SAM-dependent methyltransferase
MDKREGTSCIRCGANSRVRHLASTLLEDVAKRTGERYRTIRQLRRHSGLKIAEINELRGFHQCISGMLGLSYSEYGTANSEDLMALSYADGTFDYVLTSDTLEHVPDFEVALSEVHRVLKADGKHVFTIPVIWDRSTRRRASEVNGEVINHLPPSNHGGPRGIPSFVYNEFGGDVVDRIERAGFDVTVTSEARNKLIATFLCAKSPSPKT